MTKVASVSIGLVFLFATATICRSQPAPEEDAIKEAVRRQADVITLRQKLVQAADAEFRKELAAAAKLYENAYELVQGIGSGYGIENEAAQTVAGLARVRLELARIAQKHGELKEADAQVTRVLKVDPKNTDAQEFKKSNDKLLAERAPYIPSDAAIEKVAVAQKERAEAMTKVTDGRILLEAGRLDDAEAKFKEAIAMDPENRAAFYYVNLVKEGRFGEAESRREKDSRRAIVTVEQAWAIPVKRDSLPVPNSYATTNLIFTGKGRQAIVSKLDHPNGHSAVPEVGIGRSCAQPQRRSPKTGPGKEGD
jgi:tetratricopeptide (TPR) repeat protein